MRIITGLELRLEEVMERRAFGKTDMNVSVLGFGGAEIGFEKADTSTVRELLSLALDEGLNVIDTAECYEGSEELIGNAVGSRRNQFYLFTKCGHGPNFSDQWAQDQISKSIDRSLKRLKTDCVDLIQLHSCSEQILRKGEVIEALERAKKAGKTRYIGYSGDSTDALYAIETGAFDALQTSVSIADQQSIELTIPLATRKGMGVIAKRPLANAAWRSKTMPENSYIQPYWERLQELKYDFLNGNGNDPAVQALRFTLSVPGVHVAIVGTTKPNRWQQNASIVSKGPLEQNEFDSIRLRWKHTARPEWVGQV
jgi:aryl-alcohol dehydrogenase-like predicted oxidoreductase